jgi:hypothetical protein
MTEREAAYEQALMAIFRIADTDYRAAAVEGVVSHRIKTEFCEPDSGLALRLRSQAMARMEERQ